MPLDPTSFMTRSDIIAMRDENTLLRQLVREYGSARRRARFWWWTSALFTAANFAMLLWWLAR